MFDDERDSVWLNETQRIITHLSAWLTDLIFQINDFGFHLSVVQSDVKNLVAQQTLQRSKINQAESRVDSAQAEYERAIQQVVRSRSLLKRNYASQDEVDSMAAQQKVTQADLEEAKANLVATNDQLTVIASETCPPMEAYADAAEWASKSSGLPKEAALT